MAGTDDVGADGQGASRKEVAEIVSALIESIGIRLIDLAERAEKQYSATYSYKSWSAWKKPDRPIPPDAFDALIKLATGSASPDLIERAQRLLSEMNGIVLDQGPPHTASRRPWSRRRQSNPPSAPLFSSQRLSRRTRRAMLVSLVVVSVTIAGLGGFMLSSGESARHPGAARSTATSPRINPSTESPTPNPPTSSGPPQPPAQRPSPAPPPARMAPAPIPTSTPRTTRPTCGRADYRVESAGDILNEQGTRVDRVVPGDIFVRDMSNTHPRRPYRYYGTVKGRSVSGYVMQSRLTPGCA